MEESSYEVEKQAEKSDSTSYNFFKKESGQSFIGKLERTILEGDLNLMAVTPIAVVKAGVDANLTTEVK